MNIDDDVKVEITKISGDESRYDAWSITAQVWIDREDMDEPYCKRRVAVNILKDDNNLEETVNGTPAFVERVKEEYKEIIKEDEEYTEFSINSLEEEKNITDFEGETFTVPNSNASPKSQGVDKTASNEPVAVMAGEGRSEKPIKDS